jgi:hypothetical protein
MQAVGRQDPCPARADSQPRPFNKWGCEFIRRGRYLVSVEKPENIIEGSEKLTSVFDYWPSFHDAEILEFNLWRGDVQPQEKKYIFPVLTTKIHLWEITAEVDSRGYLVLRHHTLATVRFHDVDNFRMEGFNHQNAILGLHFTTEDRGEVLPPYVCVEFEPAFGISATFRCSRVEVVDAKPFPPFEQESAP